MKILNLYAGIGGNRKLWPDVLPNGEPVKITAVELAPAIAAVYQKFFPHDTVIVGDAHEYLLWHYKEFDFIWVSPPCQSHSRLNYFLNIKSGKKEPAYVDMTLWQEILFLKTYARCLWVIENVRPYYKPLMEPDFVIGRHYYWSNKFIFSTGAPKDFNIDNTSLNRHGFDLRGSGIKNQKAAYRNCVTPEIGKYIFDNILGLS